MLLKTKTKIALARLAQRAVTSLPGGTSDIAARRVTRRGIEWELDLREGIDFAIWLQGAFEPRTVRCYRKIVKEGDFVVDVGANVGAHTLHLAAAVGDTGRVLAVEPTDWAYAKLKRNLELNPSLGARVTAVQAKLESSDAPGEAEPVYSSWPLEPGDGRHPLHLGRLMSCSGARCMRFDTLVEEVGFERVDFIKVDIDGFECEMLAGALDTLERWRPTLVMELSPYVLEEHGASVEELLRLLGSERYTLVDADSGKRLVFDAAWLRERIPRGAGRNVVVLPA